MRPPATPLPPSGAGDAAAVTLPGLARMTAEGRKIAMLTAYDATLAAAADRAGVDVLLVGDSLGMVVQGHASTLSVSLADVLYHTRCVSVARQRALVIADLPFGSSGATLTQAVGMPVIGIGAGPACSGQVLVIYDALGVTAGRAARFVRNFMSGHDRVEAALAAYVAAVGDGSFPGPEHCF
jgi:ketopantoate hydroxymethyltransferase